jgi:hypothetical protein
MRGSIGAADYIDSLADGWSISAITCLELLAGARTKRETIDLDLVLSGYRAIPPNEDITRVGLHEVVRSAHTFEVIQQTITRANELNERAGWTEPFVRVHFLAGQAFESGELEQLVEALNTSSQVQQFTLDEYQNKFDELKEALQRGGFDPSVVAFRENEDKEWDVREIVQRLACFLKERWKTTQPASMYRSKGKALDLYTNEVSHEEFKKLYDVAADVVTLPEFIQSEFSKDTGKGRKFGKLRGVKTLKKPQTPVGTK